MTTCTCQATTHQANSFSVCASPARRQWIMATAGVGGRVFKNKPAPTNLEIPPHQYLTDTRLIIGSDEFNKA